MNETTQRLAHLESVLAHMEHQYDQLNQVIIEQGRLLARLQAQQQRISQIVEGIESDRIRATNPKPPHYQ
jgi:uncharacterized coiled-coil protein SlyX